ncbi:MAG: phage major capsid protein [Methylophilaceae bacterium]|nr:phage major capsid protein [Methyloradius sp.]
MKLKPVTLDIRKLKSEPVYRELKITREAVNVEARTVELAFASETPYDRWWGTEILDCTVSAIRLERLLDGSPLLYNHERDLHLGTIENVRLDSDKICRATVRFGKGELAEEKFQDVLDDILKKVSVGYMIYEILLISEKDQDPVYKVIDWEPFEISMVTIAADNSVGVGRGLALEDEESEEIPPVVKNLSTKTRNEPTIKEPRTMEQLTEEQQKAIDAFNKLTAAEQDAKRRDHLVEIGVKYAEYLTMQDVQDACTKGHTPAQLQELVIERQKTKHSDTSAGHVGLSGKEVANYSIARAVAALMSGDWSGAGLEREASEAGAKKFGNLAGRGFILPFDVMAKRDFTAGTATEAGNLIATTLRDDLFADVLRNRLALGQLGTTMLFGLSSNIDMPRKTVGSSLAFATEIAAAAETQPNTAKVTLSPKRITGYVEFSKQAVIQSAMAVEPMLRQDLMSEINVRAEDAAINGSGAGANPRGIRNTSGIGSVIGGTNGAQFSWAHAVNLESAVANVNAEPDSGSGYLVNTKLRGWAKQTQRATYLPYIWENGDQPLNGYRAAVTNNVPSNLTKGTAAGICSSVVYSSMWDMLVMGFFGAIEITLDEVTQATVGMNRLVVNAYVDVGCRRPANFSSMDDVLTA